MESWIRTQVRHIALKFSNIHQQLDKKTHRPILRFTLQTKHFSCQNNLGVHKSSRVRSQERQSHNLVKDQSKKK
jgi:hypothetical protein